MQRLYGARINPSSFALLNTVVSRCHIRLLLPSSFPPTYSSSATPLLFRSFATAPWEKFAKQKQKAAKKAAKKATAKAKSNSNPKMPNTIEVDEEDEMEAVAVEASVRPKQRKRTRDKNENETNFCYLLQSQSQVIPGRLFRFD